MTVKGGMLWDSDYYKLIWDRQVNMFSYHSKLVAEHPYSSWWYEWVLNLKPILYYYDASMGNGKISEFGAFGNPLVWWGGLLAILAMGVRLVRRRDSLSLLLLIGYFSQLGPWLLVTRIVFVYHYFPSTIFLVLALAHVFNTVWERGYGRYRQAVYGFTAASGAAFAMFYPVLSGVAASGTYTRYILKWLPAWLG
jgi:dolichyl-phosphate-mannose--protein O-mannosyl transferase